MGKIKEKALLDFLPHPITTQGRYTALVPKDTTLDRVLGEVVSYPGHVVCSVDGVPIPHKAWAKTYVRGGQVIQARPRPLGGADGSNPIAAVLTIAVLIAAPYAAAALLPAAAGAGLVAGATAVIGTGGIILVNSLFPPRMPAAQSGGQGQRQRQFSLTGGGNRARPNEPFLLVLGSHRVFPDIVARDYTEFTDAPRPVAGGSVQWTNAPFDDNEEGAYIRDGYEEPQQSVFFDSNEVKRYNEQNLYRLFDFGVGNLNITDLMIGQTPLTSFQDVETETTQPITLVDGNVDTIPGATFEPNVAIERETAGETTKIVFHVISQNFRVDNDGNILPGTNAFTLSYRLAGASTTTRRLVSLIAGTGEDARLPLRRAFSYIVPEGEYEVSATLTTVWNTTNPSLVASASLYSINAHQAQVANFSGRNPLAVKIRATGQIFGRLETLSADVKQLIPVWNGTAWVDDQETSNPAWILRKFWQGWTRPSDSRLMSGRGLAITRIDDEILKTWGAFCDTNGLTCDVVIDSRVTDTEIENLIAQCGWASVTKSSGKLGVLWENDDQPVTALFNPSSIVAGTVSVHYENEGLSDEITGTFLDAAGDYKENTVRRCVEGVTVPERPVTVPLRGITSGMQAAKEINRMAAAQFYHTRTITWEVGPEGGPLFVTRGDVVSLAHDLVGGTVGGRILEIDTPRTLISLSQDVPTSGTIWIWDLNGNIHTSGYTPHDGNTVTLDTALPAAPMGVDDEAMAYRFVSFDTTADPVKVRVVGVEHAPGGVFRLTARDEIPEYYTARVADLSFNLLPTRNRYRPVVIDEDVTGPREPRLHLGTVAANVDFPNLTDGVEDGDAFIAVDEGERRDGRRWLRSAGAWVYQGDLTPGSNLHYGVVAENVLLPTLSDGVSDGDIFLAVDVVGRRDGRRWLRTNGAWVLQGDLTPSLSTTTAGATRPTNPDTGSLHVDPDGTIVRWNGNDWEDTGVDLTVTGARVYSGVVAEGATPQVSGTIPTGSVFIATDGRFWRRDGSAWVFQGNLTGEEGLSGFSSQYPYNAIQKGASIPNAIGEFKLRQSAGFSSDGFSDFAGLESCVFIDLHAPVGTVGIEDALAFVKDITARIETGTTLTVWVSDNMWISYRVTSERFVVQSGVQLVEFGLVHIATRGTGTILADAAVQINLSPQAMDGDAGKSAQSFYVILGSRLAEYDESSFAIVTEDGAQDDDDYLPTLRFTSTHKLTGTSQTSEIQMSNSFTSVPLNARLVKSDRNYNDTAGRWDDPTRPVFVTPGEVSTGAKYEKPILEVVPGVSSARCVWSGDSRETDSALQYKQTTEADTAWVTTAATDSPYDISGLTGGTSYDFRVQYSKSNGVDASEFSGVVSATPRALAVPVAPVMNDLMQFGSEILASCQPVAGGVEFEFQWDNDQFFGADADESGFLDSSAYSITAFSGTSNTLQTRQYYVRARAKNSSGTGAWSTHKEIDYTDVLRPPDPTAFVASQITNHSFRMGWTPPADLTHVNGYRLLLIIPSPNSSANYYDVPGQDASYKVFTERGFGRPILPDTIYTLWIQSYNEVDGARIYSNVLTGMVTTSAATANVPGTVAGVTAMTGTGAGDVDMAWIDDADATGFKVLYVCVSPFDVGEIDVGKVPSYTLQVGAGALCSVGVQAYNANGDGPLENSDGVTVYAGAAPVVVPGAISGFTGQTGLAGQATFRWNRREGGTGYRIRYGLTNIANPGTVVDVGDVTEYILTGLTEGSTYYVDILAYNDAGDGPGIPNIAVSAGSAVVSVPNQVSGVTAVTGDGEGELDVGWTGDAAATGFKIRLMRSGGVVQVIDAGNVTSYTVTGLVPGQTYCVWVLAYNANGDGPYPITMQANAMAGGFVVVDPLEVSQFSARTGAALREIIVSWGGVAGATNFRIALTRQLDITDVQTVTLGATGSSVIMRGTIAHYPGELYNVSITPITNGEDGRTTTIYGVRSSETTTTLAPLTRIVPGSIGSTFFEFTGSRPNNDADYFFYEWSTDANYGSADSVRIPIADLQNHTIEGLDANTLYYLRGRGYDESNDLWSVPREITFRTNVTPTSLPGAIASIAQFSFPDEDSSIAGFSWHANLSSDAEQYEVEWRNDSPNIEWGMAGLGRFNHGTRGRDINPASDTVLEFIRDGDGPFRFRVRGVNGLGNGPWNEDRWTEISTAPGGTEIWNNGFDSNLLTRNYWWYYPVFADEYVIEWREDSTGVTPSPQGETADGFFGSPGTAIIPFGPSFASFITALTTITGVLIRFRVRGRNSFGVGAWSTVFWTDP